MPVQLRGPNMFWALAACGGTLVTAAVIIADAVQHASDTAALIEALFRVTVVCDGGWLISEAILRRLEAR